MDVTVALCTWNRSALLERTLSSMVRLRIPAELDWEILVVDNGSSDETPAVLNRFRSELPLRTVVEPQAGVGHARARGLAETRGALLLWTDDDVRVDPAWLAAYVEAAREYPAASFWGGRIDPLFESPPPNWLAEAWPIVASVYGERELGEKPIEIRELAHLPYGANYAARTAVHRLYPFDVRLGRRRSERVAGEETDAMQRMLDDGHRAWWIPDARVQHWVPTQALSLDYLGRYWHGAGQTSEILERSLFMPLHLGGKAVAREVRYRLQRCVAPPRVWLKSYVRAKYHWGRFSQVR